MTRKRNQLSWNIKDNPSDYFLLKSFVNNIFNKLGININKINFEIHSDNSFSLCHAYQYNGKNLLKAGIVSADMMKQFNIDSEVFYAKLNWELVKQSKLVYTPVSKFPNIKRDLALLIDKSITYKQLSDVAYEVVGKTLKAISLFDVYEGKNIAAGKTPYALSLFIRRYK